MLSSSSYTFFNKNQVFNLKDGLAYLRPAFNTQERIGTVFSEKKLEEYRLYIENGILYDSDKKPVSGRVIYILDEHGKLYGEKFYNDLVDEKFKTKHSNFKGDKPVKAAGFLKANEDGKLIGIDNDSGHFSLTLQQMVPALEYFFSRGCTEGVEFSNHEFAEKLKIVHHDLKEVISYINHFAVCGDIPETLKVNRITIKPPTENNSSEKTSVPKKYFSRFGANPITIQPIPTENSQPKGQQDDYTLKSCEKRKNFDDITNTNFSPRSGREDDFEDVKSNDPSNKKRKIVNSKTFTLSEINELADAYNVDVDEQPTMEMPKKLFN